LHIVKNFISYYANICYKCSGTIEHHSKKLQKTNIPEKRKKNTAKSQHQIIGAKTNIKSIKINI